MLGRHVDEFLAAFPGSVANADTVQAECSGGGRSLSRRVCSTFPAQSGGTQDSLQLHLKSPGPSEQALPFLLKSGFNPQ